MQNSTLEPQEIQTQPSLLDTILADVSPEERAQMDEIAKIKRSLPQLLGEFKSIESLFEHTLIESEGELTPENELVIKAWMIENENLLESKLGGYVWRMKENEQEAKIIDGRVKAFASMADDERKLRDVRQNRVKTLKDILKWFYTERGITEHKAGPYRVCLQNNGGVSPIEWTHCLDNDGAAEPTFQVVSLDKIDTDEIPERFLKPREIDPVAVRAALDAGEPLHFARFGPKGKQIRIR